MTGLVRWSEFVRLAVRDLLGYPLRSFLTALSVVFGIASVVTMLGLGSGAEEQILRQYEQMGIANVIVQSVKPPETRTSSSTGRQWISKYGVTFRDVEQVEATVPGVARVLPVHSYTERAWHGSRKEEVVVLGVRPDYFEATNLEVARGRPITEEDERERRPVCVVHLQLLRSLGWYGEPLGFGLVVGEQIYEVVGLLRDEEFQGFVRRALAPSEARENEVYAPYETVLSRIGTISMSRRSGSFEATNVEVNTLVVQADSEDRVETVARMVRTVMERFHEDRDYQITVPKELLAQKRATQRTLQVMLVLIAAISLLVGGIGVANIMLATVTERTREIGVRRAIGAKRSHVVAQFLTETVALCGAGGILGVALGWFGCVLLRWQTSWDAQFTVTGALVALAVSFVVGVLSGLFPAWRASRLDPIQALRYQ